jgi:hypothetical protein
VRHGIETKCDDCDNSDDEIELSHHTRGLGKLWLEVTKDLHLEIK